jgi:hypothetical protein
MHIVIDASWRKYIQRFLFTVSFKLAFLVSGTALPLGHQIWQIPNFTSSGQERDDTVDESPLSILKVACCLTVLLLFGGSNKHRTIWKASMILHRLSLG